MTKKTVLLDSKERLSRADAANFLRQLADKVEAGNVSLIQGNEEVSLTIPHQVTLEVQAKEKAKRQGAKHILEVEIEWTVGSDGEVKPGLELG
ncbi:MAG: amphi-Trp domain-containing protein [Anaerolineales bacterium]|jgi:amphi-Trp domain-containing protein